MKYLFFLLTGVAALMITSIAYAESTGSIKNMESGKWNLSFSANNGFSLDYAGVSLIRSSTLVVHTGKFTSQYFNYTHGNNKISVKDIPQGKEVTILHFSKEFTGTHTISLLPDKIIFRFDYGMEPDGPEGKMDYCLGYFSAQPFAGRTYHADTTEGDKSGIIPLHWQKADENFTPEYFRNLTLDSAIGKLNIKIEGDLEGQKLLDFRNGAIAAARSTPILWCGLFQKALETGKRYSQTITISIEPTPKKELPLRMVNGSGVKIQTVDKSQNPPGDEILIIPQPKEIKSLPGSFKLNADTRVVVAEDASDKDFSGALLFASDLSNMCGFDLKVIKENLVNNNKNIILVGELSRNRLLAQTAKSDGLTPPAKDEGYVLNVSPDRVIVAGYDAAGSFYGMQSLRQLIRKKDNQPFLPCCRVSDWPTLKFRGVLLFSGKNAWPFHKELIDRILTKFKYNNLILDCAYMQWKTNPKMAMDFAESQEDVRKELDYARKNFIEVTPEISALGHMEWAFKNGQNIDIAEDPSCPYTICPSRQESYDFLFSIFDEAIDLFKPKYFHIGHDEFTMRGEFPCCDLCKSKSITELFGMDIKKVCAYFDSKGIRPMIWGDMLLAPGEASSHMNAPNAIESKKRRDYVPKNVIITDWHYSPAKVSNYTSFKLFQNEGFDVIAAPWYDPRNIFGLSRAAKRDQVMGQLLTLWVGYNSNEDNLKNEKKQFTAMVLGGETAWDDKNTIMEDLPYNAAKVFDQNYECKLPEFTSRNYFTTDIRSYYNVKLADQPRGSGWIGFGPDEDLANAPTGMFTLNGIPFRLADSTHENSAIRVASTMDTEAVYPKEVNLPLNTEAKSLFFLQTTARFDKTGKKAGSYIVHYSDGTQVEIPLIYGKNITAWNDAKECSEAIATWAAYDENDDTILLRAIEWSNPSPEKIIASIDIVSGGTESGIALLGISGSY